MGVFSRREFERRVTRIKKSMSEAGIDVLMTMNPANIVWKCEE